MCALHIVPCLQLFLGICKNALNIVMSIYIHMKLVWPARPVAAIIHCNGSSRPD